MPAKKAARNAFVEHAWKIVLQQLDRGRQRSGKALARQAEVRFKPVEDQRICAQIVSKGFDGGIHVVELPCIDNWNARIDNLVFWLARRLDLLAACLSGEWNDEFLDFIHREGLRLFPDEQYAERLQWEAKCTCSSQDVICKHVVGVIYKLIWETESNPLRSLEFVRVNPQMLVDKIHFLVSEWYRENRNLDKNNSCQNLSTGKFFSLEELDSEKLAYQDCEFSKENMRARQMIPDILPSDIKIIQSLYFEL